MKQEKNIFWGVAFLLLGAVLVAGRLGYLEEVSFWTIALSVILVAFLIKGIAKRRVGTIFFSLVCLLIVNDDLLHLEVLHLESFTPWTIVLSVILALYLLKGIVEGRFGMILFSLAFLIIVNDDLLHLEAITPWPVLGAALLGTIGLKMLFPNVGSKRRFPLIGERNGVYYKQGWKQGWNGKQISYQNVVGTTVRYVSGEVEAVNIENVFGTVNVYFMDAQLPEGHINVNVDSVFGGVVLYVPAFWKVTMDMEKIFAGINEKGECTPDGIHEMHVHGDNIFGTITIIYV